MYSIASRDNWYLKKKNNNNKQNDILRKGKNFKFCLFVYVSLSHNTPPVAWAIKRAERLTISPTTAYSRRALEPTSPQNTYIYVVAVSIIPLNNVFRSNNNNNDKKSWITWPVVMPIDDMMPSWNNDCNISRAVRTARSGSFSCDNGGKPHAPMRTEPIVDKNNFFYINVENILFSNLCRRQWIDVACRRISVMIFAWQLQLLAHVAPIQHNLKFSFKWRKQN